MAPACSHGHAKKSPANLHAGRGPVVPRRDFLLAERIRARSSTPALETKQEEKQNGTLIRLLLVREKRTRTPEDSEHQARYIRACAECECRSVFPVEHRLQR